MINIKVIKMRELTIMATNELPMLPSLYGDGKARKTVTELICTKCHKIKNRDHKVGDYVFKKMEDEVCNSCKHTGMVINSIYDIIDPNNKK